MRRRISSGWRVDVEPGDSGRSRGDAEQRAQHLDRGRLTGTVGPEEAVDLAVRHVEVDPGDRFEVAEGPSEGPCLDR